MLKSIPRRATILVFVLTSISILDLAHGEGSDLKTKEMKGSVVGKVEVKTQRDQGRLIKVAFVKVILAQDESGKSIDTLLGATLKVVGSESRKVAKFAGKDVRIAGKIREGKEILVDTVTLKNMDDGGSETKTADKKKRGDASEGSDKK